MCLNTIIFSVWGRGHLNLSSIRSFCLPPVGQHLLPEKLTRWRSPGTRGCGQGTPNSPLSLASHRGRGPARGLPGRAARSAGSAYGSRVRDSNLGAGGESSLPSAAARTTPGDAAPRYSPPGRAEAPAGGQPEPARPCSARRPGVTPGARGAATVLGSTSSPAWLPCGFTQNVPSTCPLPGIFLLRPGPERLESSLPDPLSGRSSRNSGIARHGSDQLLSSPTLMLFHPRRVRTSTHDHPQISIASTPIKIRDPVPKS